MSTDKRAAGCAERSEHAARTRASPRTGEHQSTGQEVEKAVRDAYRYGERLKSQGERVLVRGRAGGLTIEMWVNRVTKTVETAYPEF